jgi:hypothetical protein
MANALALYDFNNPTILAPKPGAGSRVNWISEPSNPGLKPIVDQIYDQLTFFFDQSDATQSGKGVGFDNIANRAVRPENMRLRIDQPYKGTLLTIDNGAGGAFVQIDGQTLIKKPVVPVFQVVTNWRNFQTGIDNVTTELDIIIDRAYIANQGSLLPPTGNWTNTNQGQIGGNDRNIKIYTEVGSSAAMTDAVLVSKDAYYGYTNYTPQEPQLQNLTIKIVDKTIKSYQNPFYRITLALEKTSTQTPGTSMGLALQALVTVTTKATNTSM